MGSRLTYFDYVDCDKEKSMRYGLSPVYPIKDRTGMGNNLYVMREDLIPFSLGGNKVRIADEFFLDMEEKGCDTMIAYGNVRSNLCRVIANQCYIKKIPCYIICTMEEEDKTEKTSNSQLMKLLDAKLVFCSKNKIAETVEHLLEQLKAEGRKPYYIYGNKYGTGNEGTPARAYAKVTALIQEYEKEHQVKFDYIFHASGTGATQAGLTCGKIVSGADTKIMGVLISSREYDRAWGIIKDGMQSWFEEQKLPWLDSYTDNIYLLDAYKKGGYGKYDQDIVECIHSEFAENSLPLDPVYTGKAFWGMQQYLMEQNLKGKNILFLHTGGSPLFYDALHEEMI